MMGTHCGVAPGGTITETLPQTGGSYGASLKNAVAMLVDALTEVVAGSTPKNPPAGPALTTPLAGFADVFETSWLTHEPL
jgi:hypothetical protein